MKEVRVVDPSKGINHESEERILKLIADIKEGLDRQKLRINQLEDKLESKMDK